MPDNIEIQIQGTSRRMEACWNACDGIPTEVLEESKPGNDLFAIMRQQRDEAHTALLALLTASQMHGTGSEEYSNALFAAADLLARTGVNVPSERERRHSQPAQESPEERQHKNRSSLSIQIGDSQ